MITLNVNGQPVSVDAAPDTPLLWVLRDYLNLTGTKFGCGLALCGACTVHLDGQPTRSCVTPVSRAAGKRVTTIEGLSTTEADRVSKAVQEAWNKLDVVQCGYCQSGQIMAAAALLRVKKKPTDADIDAAMTGNVCRCATTSASERRSKTLQQRSHEEIANDRDIQSAFRPAAPRFSESRRRIDARRHPGAERFRASGRPGTRGRRSRRQGRARAQCVRARRRRQHR